LSGNLNDATYSSSGVTYSVPGALLNDSNTAVALSGTATISRPSFPLSGAQPSTTEFWFKVSSSDYSSGTIQLIADWSVMVLLENGGSTIGVCPGFQCPQTINLPYPINNGAWHLIDVEYDGSVSCSIFLDGSAIGSVGGYRNCSGNGVGNYVYGLTVGAFGYISNPVTAGSFDEVAVYPADLSPARIAARWTIGATHLNQGTLCAPSTNSAYASGVLANHPDLYLRLDELASDPSGRVAFDSSGKCTTSDPTNGTYPSSVTSVPGASGDGDTGISFAANSSARISDTAASLPTGNQPSTTEFWFKVSSSDYSSGTIQLIADWSVMVLLENGGTTLGVCPGFQCPQTINLPYPINDGKWHLIDVEYDGNVSCPIFLDGSAVGSVGNGYRNCSGNGVGNYEPGLTVGAFGYISNPVTAGSFDEVAVYPGDLSQAQIAAPYTAATNPGPTIQSISPSWAPFMGGTPVMIKGSNFGTNPTVAFTDNCAVSIYFYKTVTPTNVSPAGDSITVMAPSADSPGHSDGLYNVGLMHGPGCIKVTTANGSATGAFTWVVPEIGLLVSHDAGQPFTPGHFEGCTAEAVSSNNHLVVLTAGHCVVNKDDFAFAPGYFGADLATCSAPSNLVGSSAAFYCGTTPYGIWCEMSPAIDTDCGPTAGRTYTDPRCCDDANNDFAFLTVVPSVYTGCPQDLAITTLGNCIGGGLAITWDPGKNPAGAAKQSWNLFGYNPSFGPYLDTCLADPGTTSITGFGTPAAGWLGVHPAGPKAPSGSVCPWFAGGNSGGPWINGQNLASYGVGALNKGFWGQNQDGIAGTYLGDDAKANWRLASTAKVPSVG